ncbi:hypothetical protein SISNIDRAFT_495734 [Sistotremastrum niveocremeum HHB9708]|uniref:Wbp11/ELF5/Saf1 N-terminal domain-containing protein n=1 Tax=Sistotremastrum niveocremeum HHB9708 TaxID=1314777 RepID=A0A164U8V1_9AGAM|nr:hypothetical protein SISNIDRAFT_495734 [Sistotremastrum niveocremeum HHB9708]
MAKGKNVNPADAFRKAQRKKELKKHKAERTKTRDFSTAKKDTSELEAEINELLAKEDNLTTAESSRLSSLRSELDRINKKKEEYVAAHPEMRRLIYRTRPQDQDKDGDPEAPVKKERKIFDKNGIPVHPERSVYYDAVMNPYGVPPPGMPYMERPPMPGEVYSDAEDDDDDDEDDDVIMPEGPPPEDEDLDDIPMPEGPPPGKNGDFEEELPDGPPPLPPLPPLPPPSQFSHVPFPPPPPFLPPGAFAVPPPPFPGPSAMGPPMPYFPPPPPPPPRGFPASHVPMQSVSVSEHMPPPPFLPRKPGAAGAGSSGGGAPGVISAEAELRDFKKESTSFVPASLQRKKAKAGPGGSKVDAAPSVGQGSVTETVASARPDLMKSLGKTLGDRVAAAKADTKSSEGDDDYSKFIEEVGSVL